MFRSAFPFVAALLVACPGNAEPLPPAQAEVDLELVLAADASGSVSRELLRAQRLGFAAAFRDPKLRRVLISGPIGSVAVVYFEWAGADHQELVVPWTLISSIEDMAEFADRLEQAEDGVVGGETSISAAMLYADHLIATNPHEGLRKVVDIAGNGTNSDGPPLELGLQRLRNSGAIVNALLLPAPTLDETGPYAMLFAREDGPMDSYYRSEVIGGPGSFVVAVDLEAGFVEAILRKLVLEVAWSTQ